MLNTERVTNTIPAIELLQISKKFGKHEVLKDISLKVIPGETVCLLGPSGSGKSTLLRCINFLESTDYGEVFLHGTRVAFGRSAGKSALSEAQLARLRTRVSMV
ncbi:MAG: ATP-binding cassette domain-containing protein, partial [Oculatellaceae cyanobacterium Prado106]|nr:ATP-binding cassette domain-containing protein [Oculatellaceae cyanobacterium Prado106]